MEDWEPLSCHQLVSWAHHLSLAGETGWELGRVLYLWARPPSPHVLTILRLLDLCWWTKKNHLRSLQLICPEVPSPWPAHFPDSWDFCLHRSCSVVSFRLETPSRLLWHDTNLLPIAGSAITMDFSLLFLPSFIYAKINLMEDCYQFYIHLL